MSTIKRRRVEELAVTPHPDTKVGDYVPFYFCPRSVMLYVIHCANHSELTYRGGQEPIVHLEADVARVVSWAQANDHRWTFSLSNAGARYTEFRSQLADLGHLDWNAIAAADFKESKIKEGKQAEFLVLGEFPFALVERIGVRAVAVRDRANAALSDAVHRPTIELHPEWYY